MTQSTPEPKVAAPNRVNVYTCQTCHNATVTIDIHEGVTPFMIICRASGREGDCPGMAYSEFYRKSLKALVLKPEWEWYRPTGSEYESLNGDTRDHVDKGGLLIRRRERK